MKKILFVVGILLLTGCGGPTEEVSCTINGKEAIFTLKDGIVSNYVLDGSKMSQSEIDEINGEYFTSSKNNEEGKVAVNTYVNTQNGSCN